MIWVDGIGMYKCISRDIYSQKNVGAVSWLRTFFFRYFINFLIYLRFSYLDLDLSISHPGIFLIRSAIATKSNYYSNYLLEEPHTGRRELDAQ